MTSATAPPFEEAEQETAVAGSRPLAVVRGMTDHSLGIEAQLTLLARCASLAPSDDVLDRLRNADEDLNTGKAKTLDEFLDRLDDEDDPPASGVAEVPGWST